MLGSACRIACLGRKIDELLRLERQQTTSEVEVLWGTRPRITGGTA